ncbi:hypothetical protein [uncultured Tateyamaria sp.]|uniref:hypothetical protein n=1 Tax=uncultured Tateyamaria sp. TaxID=455651 RepID=UPI0026397923|nr:hypothetical protein [uncultured Tateyamaria sp.]
MTALWHMVTMPFRRAPRRPLSARRPDRDEMGQTRVVPLGMEATDLTLVNKVNRRNDALERVNQIKTDGTAKKGGYMAEASTHIQAMPEDETYAARFHRAFHKKGK